MDVADWARAVAALVATLALLGLVALLARRFNMLQPLRGPGERRLSVVESLMLDPRRRLVIVREGGQDHVLLLSPFGDSRLSTAPSPPEPAAPLAPLAPAPPQETAL
jgi:flagellar protein FliO/FliZ